MATSLHIHVIEAPITEDHLLVALSSYPEVGMPALWKAVGKAVDEGRDVTDEERASAETEDAPLVARIERARAQFAEDDALMAAAIEAYERTAGVTASRDPFPDGTTWDEFVRGECANAFMQMYLLAPRLYVGESYLAADDHPIYDLVGRPIVLERATIATILDAVGNAADPAANVTDKAVVSAFLARHAGKVAAIIGH